MLLQEKFDFFFAKIFNLEVTDFDIMICMAYKCSHRGILFAQRLTDKSWQNRKSIVHCITSFTAFQFQPANKLVYPYIMVG